MDTERLKNRIREALGAAGLPRGVSDQIERIIDESSGEKKEEPPRTQARSQPQPQTQPARVHLEDEEDDDDASHRSAMARVAETRAKPVQKTKRAPRKKK
jgi:hypothetical protein